MYSEIPQQHPTNERDTARKEIMRIGQSYLCQSASILVMRYGQTCPYCLDGIVDYDSSLNLYCEKCKKIQTGVFT